MRNKKTLLRVKLLTFASITILVTVSIYYQWIEHQKIDTWEKLYSLSESNTRVTETIQSDSKSLKNQLSKIESRMAQVQSNIQYLMSNQNNTVSAQEAGRQTVIENDAVNFKTTDSNEYQTRTKIKDNKEQMELIVQDDESTMYEREELLQSMAQDTESDPEWSMEASQSIYEAFSDNEINNSIQLENVECGATLCKANLYSDGTTKIEDSYSEILSRIPWHGQGFAQINEESGSIDFYLAREGHELPYLENEPHIAEHN
ncbi:MAG: hypothetical protein V3V18_09490 [Methylococcales bacterium]